MSKEEEEGPEYESEAGIKEAKGEENERAEEEKPEISRHIALCSGAILRLLLVYVFLSFSIFLFLSFIIEGPEAEMAALPLATQIVLLLTQLLFLPDFTIGQEQHPLLGKRKAKQEQKKIYETKKAEEEDEKKQREKETSKEEKEEHKEKEDTKQPSLQQQQQQQQQQPQPEEGHVADVEEEVEDAQAAQIRKTHVFLYLLWYASMPVCDDEQERNKDKSQPHAPVSLHPLFSPCLCV